jgi:hypothetical protein
MPLRKAFEAQAKRHAGGKGKGGALYWEMPYLPIDPADLGCTYEAVIRVNSQSGKGGIAYLVKQALQLDVPRKMQVAFYQVVQEMADRTGREMTVEDITTAFCALPTTTVKDTRVVWLFVLSASSMVPTPKSFPYRERSQVLDEHRRFEGRISVDGTVCILRGEGNGPLSALLDALQTHLDLNFSVREYSEHAVGQGTNVQAASYVELVETSTGEAYWGVGLDSDIAGSGLKAVISAVNLAIKDGRKLPEHKLGIAYNMRSTPGDLGKDVLKSMGLEIPRSMQPVLFEIVQAQGMPKYRSNASSSSSMLRLCTTSRCRSYMFTRRKVVWPLHRCRPWRATVKFRLKSFNLKAKEDGARLFSGTVVINRRVVPSSSPDGQTPVNGTHPRRRKRSERSLERATGLCPLYSPVCISTLWSVLVSASLRDTRSERAPVSRPRATSSSLWSLHMVREAHGVWQRIKISQRVVSRQFCMLRAGWG